MIYLKKKKNQANDSVQFLHIEVWTEWTQFIV